jgi:hypothetical protein
MSSLSAAAVPEPLPKDYGYKVEPDDLKTVVDNTLNNFGYKVPELEGLTDPKERFKKIIDLVCNGTEIKGVKLYGPNDQNQHDTMVFSYFINTRFLGLEPDPKNPHKLGNKGVLLSHHSRDSLKEFFKSFCVKDTEPKVFLMKDVENVRLERIPDFVKRSPKSFVYMKIVINV